MMKDAVSAPHSVLYIYIIVFTARTLKHVSVYQIDDMVSKADTCTKIEHIGSTRELELPGFLHR